MKTQTDIALMIEILEDATMRSEQEEAVPRQFTEKRELALIYDMIEAFLIRGKVARSAEGPPCGASMWGITLSGREYLSKLKTHEEETSWRSRAGKLFWAMVGVLVGILVAASTAVVSAIVLKIFKLK
jgi:hypothetical protein